MAGALEPVWARRARGGQTKIDERSGLRFTWTDAQLGCSCARSIGLRLQHMYQFLELTRRSSKLGRT